MRDELIDRYSAFPADRGVIISLLRGVFFTAPSDRGSPRWAVEVGCYRGRTSRVLAQEVKELGGKLLCVDPWDGATDASGENDFAEFVRSVTPFLNDLTGLESTVRIKRDGSLDTPPPSDLRFVFIDGDHRYPAPLDDMRHWWAGLEPGGVMAVHDTFDIGWGPGVMRALNEFVLALPKPVAVRHHVYYPTPEEAARHDHGISGLSWVFKGAD